MHKRGPAPRRKVGLEDIREGPHPGRRNTEGTRRKHEIPAVLPGKELGGSQEDHPEDAQQADHEGGRNLGAHDQAGGLHRKPEILAVLPGKGVG